MNKMKLSELIEELKKYPQDVDVRIDYYRVNPHKYKESSKLAGPCYHNVNVDKGYIHDLKDRGVNLYIEAAEELIIDLTNYPDDYFDYLDEDTKCNKCGKMYKPKYTRYINMCSSCDDKERVLRKIAGIEESDDKIWYDTDTLNNIMGKISEIEDVT